MSRLTRDGTAEPVSRDQILRHARGQGNIHFPCSADHEQDWQPYPVDTYSAICDDHTYIHTYIQPHTRVKISHNCNTPATRVGPPKEDRSMIFVSKVSDQTRQRGYTFFANNRAISSCHPCEQAMNMSLALALPVRDQRYFLRKPLMRPALCMSVCICHRIY